MGFIGYSRHSATGTDEVIRIYMECNDEPAPQAGRTTSASYGSAVDVIFPNGGSPCRLRGVEGVLVLKKFYKLVFSLEERAREHGNDWRSVMRTPAGLLEHLRYTRNARDFTELRQPRPRSSSEESEPPGDACITGSDRGKR